MNEFIKALEAMLELEPSTLEPATPLSQIPGWDSMAVVGFLALADEIYSKAVAPSAIQKCATVADLAALVGKAAAGAPAC
jgi:acyl carrier protein